MLRALKAILGIKQLLSIKTEKKKYFFIQKIKITEIIFYLL